MMWFLEPFILWIVGIFCVLVILSHFFEKVANHILRDKQ